MALLPMEHTGRVYRQHVDKVVMGDVLQIDREMRARPAHMVCELLSLQPARRLPRIDVDDEAMRAAAARIKDRPITGLNAT